jgi:hypothetical protein
MSKKNKIYWFEGVTEKGVKDLLNNENSKFRWLRPQRNRRVLVILMAIGLVLTSMIFATFGCYSFLRIAVRSIADAPDELLDERQIAVRNTSFRYGYFILSYILMGLMVMMMFGPDLKMFEPEGNDGSYLVISIFFAIAALPSMVMAWRERDI